MCHPVIHLMNEGSGLEGLGVPGRGTRDVILIRTDDIYTGDAGCDD